MLQIPNLADTHFDFLAVRFGFDLDIVSQGATEYFLTDGAEPTELAFLDAQTNQHIVYESSCEEGAQGLIRLTLERLGSFQLRKVSSAPLELISGSFANVTDELPTWAYVNAEFSIPHSMLPRDGLITRMLGLRATIGGGEFVLTGAKLTSRSEPTESVSCSLDLLGTEGSENVSGSISFEFNGAADFHCLKNALIAAEDRLHRVVLELLSPAEHASS